MKNLRNPFWLFLLVTIPVLVILWIYWGAYSIIGSLLEPDDIEKWKLYGGCLSAIGVLFTVYALYCQVTGRMLHPVVGVLLPLLIVPFLIFFVGAGLIPWSVPRWMVTRNDLQIYTISFLMPALIYVVLLLVDWVTPNPEDNKGWKNLLLALAFPLCWYMGIQFDLDFFHGKFFRVLLVVMMVVSTVLFFILLMRFLYIIVNKKQGVVQRFRTAFLIVVTLILPVIALMVHNGDFRFRELREVHGALGDFTSAWVYILLLINGTLLCIPPFQHFKGRVALYIARCITYSFTFYFFLVVVPYFPVAILAIVIFGLGILMLTPLILMFVHTKALADDRKFLLQGVDNLPLNVLTVASVLILPLCIFIQNQHEKSTLHAALDYVYNPDLSKPAEEIDNSSLNNTLSTLRNYKDRRRGDFFDFSGGRPYLDTWYKWQVLDNLTLANAKIDLLENIFISGDTGSNATSNNRFATRDTSVQISDYVITSEYDAALGLWKSTVDLQILNKSGLGRQEFLTTFSLPDGCWISDYYLVVGTDKKKGLLVEKKAATWVYSQIVLERQDPGLLRYLDDGSIEFRVFPFGAGEKRKTGITFAHLEPVKIEIDSVTLQLGRVGEQAAGVAHQSNAPLLYVSSTEKLKCQQITRGADYYFIIDMSRMAKASVESHIAGIEKLKQKFGMQNCHYIAANYRGVQLGADWQSQLRDFPCEGGFYAEQAIRQILYQSYKRHDAVQPVCILITDTPEAAIFTRSLHDLLFTAPESQQYYVLHSNGRLSSRSLVSHFFKEVEDSVTVIPQLPVYRFEHQSKQYYVPVDSQGSFVFTDNLMPEQELDRLNYSNALLLEASRKHLALHPEETNHLWLSSIKSSFRTSLLTPFTAFMVVETEAQEKALLAKQQETLGAKKNLDTSETEFLMDEPPLWLLLSLLAGSACIFFFIRRKKRKSPYPL